MAKRAMLKVQPGLQRRMVLFWMLQAFVATFLTCLVTIGWTFFYVNPTLAGYANIFVRPALAISAVVGFVVSCLAGLFYSRRVAGPVYRLKAVIDEVLEGKKPEIVVLRRHDELKDLTASLNKLLLRFQQTRNNTAF